MKAKYSYRSPDLSYFGCGSALSPSNLRRLPPPEPPEEPLDHNFSFFIDGGGFLGVYGENITRKHGPLSPEPAARRRHHASR